VDKTYEWAVIGSGIAGISIAEILSRQGHDVILIEKNEGLASETTREFHEWLHTGSLYTLIPDRLKTLRFVLGAIDDLIEFYSSYERMNIIPTLEGLRIDNSNNGWFNDNYIYFNYRIKGRKVTFPWLIGVARSIYLIKKIHQHDWLRRRAGEVEPFMKGFIPSLPSMLKELITFSSKYKSVRTPDFGINSRILLRDMISNSINNGLQISLNNSIEAIYEENGLKTLNGSKENIKAKKVAICSGEGIKKFSNVKISTTFAPIAVVSGVPRETKSFVELDYFPKNCINLLTKDDGYGLAGGITLRQKNQCDEYLDKVMQKHKKLNGSIKEEYRYIGLKNEITFKNEPRGYLYHIVESGNDVWSIIPGKFSLAFSLAPEFYRRVYNKNPSKKFTPIRLDMDSNQFVSNTVWFDILNKNRKK